MKEEAKAPFPDLILVILGMHFSLFGKFCLYTHLGQAGRQAGRRAQDEVSETSLRSVCNAASEHEI